MNPSDPKPTHQPRTKALSRASAALALACAVALVHPTDVLAEEAAPAAGRSIPSIETALGTTSFGSYGEAIYNNQLSTGKDEINLERVVLLLSHEFNSWISLHTELELEDAHEFEAEQAYLEFRPFEQPALQSTALRAGLLLVPVGYFNSSHEPTTFYSVERPDLDLYLVPSTWRELGVSVAGQPLEWLSYELQINNSLAIATEDNEIRFGDVGVEGIRGLRQQGVEAAFNDVGVAGRVVVTPTLGLSIGGSFFTGGADQSASVIPGSNIGGDATRVIVTPGAVTSAADEEGEALVALPDTRITVLQTDARFARGGFDLRAEYAVALIDHTAELSELAEATVGKRQQGFYLEGAYDVLRLITDTEQRLALYYRYSWMDLQDQVPSGFERDLASKWTIHSVGVAWFPIPEVVAKLDYEARDDAEGERPDRVNVGLGYFF